LQVHEQKKRQQNEITPQTPRHNSHPKLIWSDKQIRVKQRNHTAKRTEYQGRAEAN